MILSGSCMPTQGLIFLHWVDGHNTVQTLALTAPKAASTYLLAAPQAITRNSEVEQYIPNNGLLQLEPV